MNKKSIKCIAFLFLTVIFCMLSFSSYTGGHEDQVKRKRSDTADAALIDDHTKKQKIETSSTLMSTKTSKTYNAEALSTLQESVPTVESLTNDQTNVQAFVDDFNRTYLMLREQ